MKTYELFVFRHGLTEANEKGKYIGRTDVPLTTSSINQLHYMAETYRYPQADLFYVSPLTRCIQTLRILYPGKQAIAVEELQELDFGAFEGKTALELQDDPDFQAWTSGKAPAPPEGESTGDLIARITNGFAAIVRHMMSTGEQKAVIITHGGVMMQLLAACGLPQQQAALWRCDPGCGYRLRVTPSLFMRSGVVEVVGEVPEC